MSVYGSPRDQPEPTRGCYHGPGGPTMPATSDYADLETKLRPRAKKLRQPRPGDWLAEHQEPGQDFAEYLADHPVRRSETLNTIYLCLGGDFTVDQQQILELAQHYL